MEDEVTISKFAGLAMGMLAENEINEERPHEERYRRAKEFVIAATAIQVMAIASLKSMSPTEVDMADMQAKAVEYARLVLKSAKTYTPKGV